MVRYCISAVSNLTICPYQNCQAVRKLSDKTTLYVYVGLAYHLPISAIYLRRDSPFTYLLLGFLVVLGWKGPFLRTVKWISPILNLKSLTCWWMCVAACYTRDVCNDTLRTKYGHSLHSWFHQPGDDQLPFIPMFVAYAAIPTPVRVADWLLQIACE